MSYFGLAIFALCAASGVYSLMTRRIPSRWPVPAIERDSHPGSYWFVFGVNCFAALIGLVIAFPLNF